MCHAYCTALLKCSCWGGGPWTGASCYAVFPQYNPFTPLGVGDIVHGLCRLLHLLCGVGLCLVAASVAHYFPLLASGKAASGDDVGIPTDAIDASMAPMGMASWLLYFLLPLFYLTLQCWDYIGSRLCNTAAHPLFCSDSVID